MHSLIPQGLSPFWIWSVWYLYICMVSYSSDPKRAKSLRLILILKFNNVHEIVWDNIPENKNLSIRESLIISFLPSLEDSRQKKMSNTKKHKKCIFQHLKVLKEITITSFLVYRLSQNNILLFSRCVHEVHFFLRIYGW